MAKKLYKLTPELVEDLYQIAKNLPVFPKVNKDGSLKVKKVKKTGAEIIKEGITEAEGQPIWPHIIYIREEILMENPMTHLRRAAEQRKDILEAREQYLAMYKEYKTNILAHAKSSTS